MAQTLTPSSTNSGKGPVMQGDGRVTAFKHYVMDFSTSNYTTGGEDISAIWSDFREVLHICVQQRDTNTAADRREPEVDYSAKTVLLYDAFNTEETASDQGVVTLSFLAYGYV